MISHYVRTGRWLAARVATMVVSMLLPVSAFAYVGPGAGLTAIGTILALVAAVLLAIVGFVWYPVKRFLRKGKAQPPTGESSTAKDIHQSPEE